MIAPAPEIGAYLTDEIMVSNEKPVENVTVTMTKYDYKFEIDKRGKFAIPVEKINLFVT